MMLIVHLFFQYNGLRLILELPCRRELCDQYAERPVVHNVRIRVHLLSTNCNSESRHFDVPSS